MSKYKQSYNFIEQLQKPDKNKNNNHFYLKFIKEKNE